MAPFSHPLGDGSSCCPSLMVLLFPGPRRAWSPKDLLQAVIGHPTSGPACRKLALLWQSLGACHSGPDYACYLPLHRAVLPLHAGEACPAPCPSHSLCGLLNNPKPLSSHRPAHQALHRLPPWTGWETWGRAHQLPALGQQMPGSGRHREGFTHYKDGFHPLQFPLQPFPHFLCSPSWLVVSPSTTVSTLEILTASPAAPSSPT